MDELIIKSKFMQKLIGNFLRRLLIRKYKCVADVNINTLNVVIDDDNANVHIDLQASCSRSDLEKLLFAISSN